MKNISFSLEKGRAMGIVGQTGSGKSTIINLTAGFYSPTGGRILINGHDYVDMDIAGIRHHTALVMQDPILFAGTVRKILYDSWMATPARMIKALKRP